MRLIPLAPLLCLLLAGCATAPETSQPAPVRDTTAQAGNRSPAEPRARVMPRLLPETADRPPATKTPIAPKPAAEPDPGSARAPAWGQRYYLDDGPGDMPPTEMDRIPDAVPVEEDPHRFANRPYSVFGVTYEPAAPPGSFSQRGIASWYGRRFHGKPTSSGEPYDMYKMSAAHPTLPIPSYARVTNLANGRSVVVRINDRGPFHPGRIMDVSYAAAHRLGYASKGSAEVLVEALRPGERIEDQGAVPGAAARPAENVMSAAPPQKSASRPEGLWLQLGAFRERANAEKMRKSVAEHLGEFPERLEIFEHRGAWRLGLGPLRDDSALRSTQSRLLELTGVRAIPLKP